MQGLVDTHCIRYSVYHIYCDKGFLMWGLNTSTGTARDMCKQKCYRVCRCAVEVEQSPSSRARKVTSDGDDDRWRLFPTPVYSFARFLHDGKVSVEDWRPVQCLSNVGPERHSSQGDFAPATDEGRRIQHPHVWKMALGILR